MDMDQVRKKVHKLAQDIASMRSEHDKRAIIRAAERIYNVAARNENALTKKITAKRYPVARDLQRNAWVRERFNWRLLQDDCKLIVELVHSVDNGEAVQR